jgi:hypothetical protein
MHVGEQVANMNCSLVFILSLAQVQTGYSTYINLGLRAKFRDYLCA